VNAKQRRAAPLSADERRKSIVSAVIPLLLEQGAAVTTKQMADAAGVAEGTIFGVFDDKAALVYEAVRSSLDPAPVQAALSHIHVGAPIDVQMAEAARILLERYETVIALFSVLRSFPGPHEASHASGPPDFVVEANTAINQSLTHMFEMHRPFLRIEPSKAAVAFRSLVFASRHSALTGHDRLSVQDIVAVLTAGIMEPVSV